MPGNTVLKKLENTLHNVTMWIHISAAPSEQTHNKQVEKNTT